MTSSFFFIFYNWFFSEPPIQQRASHLLGIQSTQDVKMVSSIEKTIRGLEGKSRSPLFQQSIAFNNY